MSRAIDAATSPGLAGDAPETSLNGIKCEGRPEHEVNNFIWLTIHQVMVRIGWVFKTESIIMPFFMDMIGGGPVLRGSLMVFNRVGFSLLPVLFARTLKLMPQKRFALGLATLGMAGPFTLLSFVWWSGVWRGSDGEPVWWMPYFFLIVYGIFFAITGVNQLASHSIQGKLIQAERRGRLFAASVLFGAPAAIVCAWWLMPRWLALPDRGFTLLFAAPAVMFAIGSLAMLGIREPYDQFEEPSMSAWRRLRDTWGLMLHDESLRGVALAALLYSTTFTLFPHYQALARQTATDASEGGFQLQSLMVWTVVQHTAVAILSLLAGPLADRFGTRLSVRLTVFGSALAPLTAIGLAMLSPEVMADWFWIVFLPIGFTPVTIKMLINYTLELVETEDHPRYISAIGMCLALPVIVGSPLVGCLVGLLGCVPVFALGAAVMLAAGVQTLRLHEPRHS